jgi:transcriptional regulator with XRE-family HTH domain
MERARHVPTLAVYVERHLAYELALAAQPAPGIDRPSMHPNRIRERASGLRAHVVPTLGAQRLDELTLADIAGLYASLEQRMRGRYPRSILSYLSRLLKAAKADGLVDGNVALDLQNQWRRERRAGSRAWRESITLSPTRNRLQPRTLAWMAENGLSRSDAARRIGRGHTTITRWLEGRPDGAGRSSSGRNYLTRSALEALAAELGITYDQALEEGGGVTGEEAKMRHSSANYRKALAKSQTVKARQKRSKSLTGRECPAVSAASRARAAAAKAEAERLGRPYDPFPGRAEFRSSDTGRVVDHLNVWFRWHTNPSNVEVYVRLMEIAQRTGIPLDEVKAIAGPYLGRHKITLRGRPPTLARDVVLFSLFEKHAADFPIGGPAQHACAVAYDAPALLGGQYVGSDGNLVRSLEAPAIDLVEKAVARVKALQIAGKITGVFGVDTSGADFLT